MGYYTFKTLLNIISENLLITEKKKELNLII